MKLELKRKDDEIIRLRHIVDTEREVHSVKERAMQQFLQELKVMSTQLKHAMSSMNTTNSNSSVSNLNESVNANSKVYLMNILHDLSKKFELIN